MEVDVEAAELEAALKASLLDSQPVGVSPSGEDADQLAAAIEASLREEQEKARLKKAQTANIDYVD